MINVLNRSPLLITNDHNRFLDVIDALKKNNIEYSIKIETPQLSERTKKFGLGNSYSSSGKHIIYVRRKDEEKARYIMNNIW